MGAVRFILEVEEEEVMQAIAPFVPGTGGDIRILTAIDVKKKMPARKSKNRK